jgi:ribose transport system ATP-binding protein
VSGARFAGLRSLLGRSGWIPFAALLLLMAIIGAITQAHTSVFLSELNIASLLTLAAPLALLALGQQMVLIAGGFDISIGSAMSLSVVLASFWVTQPHLYESVPGILAVLGIGACVGLLNGLIVRVLGVSPIITTVAMLGILQGVAILLRPEPGGVIGSGLTEAVSSRAGFLPWIFVGTLALALVLEVWLWLTPSGLTLRATGLGEEPSRRTGVQVQRIKIGAYVVCSAAALGGGLLLAGQVGLGQNSAGATYTLPAFTACFLGGAGLAGGRGSFVGALVGAVFLTMLVNVTPLLSLPSATSELITGVLTVVAVVAYSFRFGTGTSRTGKHHELDDPPAVPVAPAEVAS